VTSPRCSASAMRTHRATARDHVDLPCRRRRCRPRRCCASALLAPFQTSAPAPAACRARAPLARLCRPVTSPRCSPLRCAHTAPQPEIMSTFPADVAAAARAVAARRLFLPLCQLGAGSRRAPSSRAACAPRSPRDITSLLASAMRTPRATARDHVGLSCRRRRCRPRRCCASTLLAPLPARCRLTPRAERAHLLRSLVTIVTSPRALCDTHHCAAAQVPADLPRRRRCCRLRRRGASMLLALSRARRRPVPRAE